MFEWAADLMTRYAHVGDLGKTAVQLIRGSKSSRNIAQFGEKILYNRRNYLVTIEETCVGHVFGWDFSGHETAIR